MTYRILSCDGGGIRGYISSTLIKNLNDATGGKLLSQVDGFAGTSTGGLISLALVAGVQIEDIICVYANEGPKIFTKNWWGSRTEAQEQATREALGAQGLDAGPGYTVSQYNAKGLTKVINKLLKGKPSTLGDITNKMVAVNTVQLLDPTLAEPRWQPVTFNNRGVGADYSAITLVNAALATSAAPTYFPPHKIDGRGCFADGGTFANNPVMNAVEVALTHNKSLSLGDIEIISLGTGLSPTGLSVKDIGNPLDWGVYSWLKPWGNTPTPLLNLTLDLSAANAGGIIERLLGDRIVRINPVMHHTVALDNYDPAAYAHMNDAISAAMKSQVWQDAIKLINSW